jgi:hypothetical protein
VETDRTTVQEQVLVFREERKEDMRAANGDAEDEDENGGTDDFE